MRTPSPFSQPWSKSSQVLFSISDQVLSVSGMFLINLVLARVQSKEEYGIFALSYSVFTFLGGLHNAALLETYTIYGAGRYHHHYADYAWLIWRSNAWLSLAMTALLLLAWRVLAWSFPGFASRSLLALALTCGILFTASLVRRMLYVQRKARFAAKLSAVFFCTVAVLLWLFVKVGLLNSFWAFVIAALGWTTAIWFLRKELPRRGANRSFSRLEPNYWSEHWRYARWVVVTAFVFQLTNQGYYWLVAGFLSLKEVAELRALYMLVSPVDQLFVAVAFVVIPMLAHRYASKQMGELVSLWRKYLLLSILVTAGFAGLIRWVGPRAVHLIYGGKFDDVAGLLGTLALLPIVMGAGNAINAALKSMERPSIVFYAYLAAGIVTVLGGVPVVIHFGLRGAVYGMLLSAGAYAVTLAVGLSFALQFQFRVVPLAPGHNEGGI